MQETTNPQVAGLSSAPLTANRTYKARIFEMIFSDKKELSDLYSGITNETNLYVSRMVSLPIPNYDFL